MATWNGICTASNHDAKEASGTMTLTDSPINLSAGTQWAGLLFPNCTVPKDAPIISSTLTLNLIAGNTAPNGLVIYGEDVDDAGVFTSGASNISNRTRTTASATWSGGALGGGDKDAPDLSAIVAEITSRAGWAAGNDLALIIDSMASTDFRFTTYDGSTTLCARLVVVYSTGGGALPVMAQYYARMREG